MKDARAIAQVFERFQRERVAFAGSVSDLARHDQNVEALREAGAAAHLQHLLTDTVPGLRCTAANALARLATQSEAVASTLVADGVVHTLVKMMGSPKSEDVSKRREQTAQRRAAAACLRGVAKHGTGEARAVAEAGGLQAAAACLETNDADTREAAAWIVECVAGQGAELAQAAVAAGVLPPLVAVLDCSEVAAKRTAAAALGSVAQHGGALARAVAEAGAVPRLAAALASGDAADARLARNTLCTLGQVAQGGPDLAAAVVAGGALPDVTRCLASGDELVQRYAAAALRDVGRHSEELAGAVVSTPGCLQMLVACTAQAKGLNQLPGIMALGYLSSFSASLAEAVITCGGLAALTSALASSSVEPVQCAAAWAVGQAGHHCTTHSQAVAESGALLALAGLEVSPQASADLACKSGKAAAAVVAMLASLPVLDALLRMAVSVALKTAVLDQVAVVLAPDNAAKSAFVQSGGLQAVQELGEEPGSPFQEGAARIAALFPKEVANRYSPAYNRVLLERLAIGGDPAAAAPAVAAVAALPAVAAVAAPVSISSPRLPSAPTPSITTPRHHRQPSEPAGPPHKPKAKSLHNEPPVCPVSHAVPAQPASVPTPPAAALHAAVGAAPWQQEPTETMAAAGRAATKMPAEEAAGEGAATVIVNLVRRGSMKPSAAALQEAAEKAGDATGGAAAQAVGSDPL